MRILGIDTSNYTTSAALFDGETISHSKKMLAVKPGERGLRQSDAVFAHVRQLNEVLAPLLEGHPALTGIGVSDRPRDIKDSYMPCFLAGVSTAKSIGLALGVPVDCFSHQQGHIAAALYSAGRLALRNERFIAFHVSGGTTEALLVSPDRNNCICAEQIAASLDLKAGQAIDRTGVLLGLQFPCGIELEKLALQWQEKITYTPAMKGENCSLSGVENLVKKMLEQDRPKEEIARFTIEAILKTLDKMCSALLKKHGRLPVLFSGGVASNTIIRSCLETKYGAFFANPAFSADNGAGAAILTAIKREQI